MSLKMANQLRFCQNCKRDIAVTNYIIHSLHCERNIQLCNLCNEPVPKSEKDQHYEEYHSVEACKLCNTRKEKWQMAKHKEVCIKRLVDCNFCQLQIPLDELEEHNEMCGSRTEKCPVCNDYVMLKDLDRHREICQNQSSTKSQGKCSYCQEIVPWIDMREHESYCYLSTYQSDDEDVSKRDVDHVRPRARKKDWQSDSRPQKRTADNSIIQKMKQCEYCKERFPDLIMTTHLESCKEHPYTCELCLMSFPLKDRVNHEQNYCPMISGNENCYAASGYTKSYEKKMKDCPYCSKKFPELMFRDHQEMCDESPYQCNLCLKPMPLKERTNHDTNECVFMGKKRKQFSYKSGLESGPSIKTTVYERQHEKKWKDCPYCEIKLSESMFINHLEICDERPYKCSLCNSFVPLKNKTCHERNECKSKDKIHKQFSGSNRVYSKDETCVSVYTKDSSSYSGHFDKDSLEFNHESCPYCHHKIPAQRIAEHVQLCSENKRLCRFCGTVILISDEIFHMDTCIGARYLVEDSPASSDKTEFQEVAGNKKNKKSKKKNQKQNEPPAPKSGFFSGILSWGKDSGPKKNYTSTFPQMVAHQFPQVVLLPCEFCNELFPEHLIIDHQSGCRPDLTSLPQSETTQYSNVHEAYHNRNPAVGIPSNMNTKDVESTGAKPKRYPISRNSSDVAPGEFLNKRIRPVKEEPDSGRDYYHYPTGVPEHSYLMESKASKLSKKLHQDKDEDKDNQDVQEHKSQKIAVKNTKTSIFNFSASSNENRKRNLTNQAISSPPRVSKYDFDEDAYNAKRQGFSEDESSELKAVGAERAEKKGIIQISRDTSIDYHGVYSEVSVNYDRSNQDSDAVSNEVCVEHDSRNQLSPTIPITSRNSDKLENSYSEEKFNIRFGEENYKIIESEKVKSYSTRLLDRLENIDLQSNITKPWENDCTEDDAKNEETFGNNNTNFDENFDLTQVEDNFSDSGEHFFDAVDDFKIHSIEANDSTSSSPNKDSNLDVYFRFLRKGKDELIGANDMKNERTPTPEVESTSVCECGNEICYCAIINQPSLENNYLQKGTENFEGTFAKGATPSVCLQRDLNTYSALKSASTNSQCGKGNISGEERLLNSHNAEIEKRSSTWNEWRNSKNIDTDSD